MPQTATSGNLANAQGIIISATRYTAEHNAPAMALTQQFKLAKGNKSVTVPKVGQYTFSAVADGQDIVEEQDIGMTTVDLTASIVGAKIIVTDQLVDQSQPEVFQMVGKQLGSGLGRRKDTDVHALYTALNGGTTFGAAASNLNAATLLGCIARAKAGKFGDDIYVLLHPNTIASYVMGAAVIGVGTTPVSQVYPIPAGWSADLLKKFWTGIRPINGVPIWEDGNLTIDSSGDVIGVIANRDALCTLTSVAMKTERERDASRIATEIVMTARYGVFELDDTRGAPMTYDAAARLTTTA